MNSQDGHQSGLSARTGAHAEKKVLGEESKLVRIGTTKIKTRQGSDKNGEGSRARKSEKACCHIFYYYMKIAEKGTL